ncbi:Alpha-pyrone synthesis polyketide synthase-like Pks18 [compost metagenome]
MYPSYSAIQRARGSFCYLFFGDGASACVVRMTSYDQKGIFALGDHHSALISDSSSDMVWTVGSTGFSLYLSPRIPELIGQSVPIELERLIGQEVKPELWAIHPGGRGIIDKLQVMYDLTDAQTRPSRTILRDYGNMSSATLLFVLQEMRQGLQSRLEGHKDGIAIAFGPGLSMELMKISYIEGYSYA